MLKKALILGLCGIMAASVLVGCGKEKVPSPSFAEDSTVNDTVGVKTSKDVDVAKSFVNALASGSYDDAIVCLNIDSDKSFLSSEDIAFSLPRTSFADIGTDAVQGSEPEYTSTYSTGAERSTVNVVFKKDGTETATVSIPTILNENNEWKVDAPDFYHTDFTFRAPSGDVKITVNGKELSKDFVLKSGTGDSGFMCDYKLPYVGKKGLTVNLSCDNYTKDFVLMPSSSNEVDDDSCVGYDLTDAEAHEVLDYIKNTWNSMYADYVNGKTANDLIAYLSDHADSDIAKKIRDGFDDMENGQSFKDDEFEMTDIRLRDAGAFYVTDSIIVVNFNYELKWHYGASATWMENMKRSSNIMVEKTSDGYKIYKLTDDGLFTARNGFTQDW